MKNKVSDKCEVKINIFEQGCHIAITIGKHHGEYSIPDLDTLFLKLTLNVLFRKYPPVAGNDIRFIVDDEPPDTK